MYTENYKHRWKKLKNGNMNRWKNILCPWIARLNIVKMFTLPKAICRVNAIPIKIRMAFFFYRNRENNYKIPKEPKGPKKTKQSGELLTKADTSCFLISKHIIKLQNGIGILKQYGTCIRYRIESSEINPHIHSQLIFDKGTKNT